MKKALSLLIIACLVTSICFAGGAKEAEKSTKADISFNKEGLPIVNEPITFEIAIVFALFDFASFNAAIVSAVSPD